MIGAGTTLNILSSAGKQAAPALTVVLADLTIGGIDLATAGGIVLGLFAGAVLRSSRFVGPEQDTGAMRRDWLVSGMAAMANFIIAAIAVALGSLVVPGFPVLAAMGVGLLFGYRGPDSIKWLNERYFGKDTAPIEQVTMMSPEPKRRVTKGQRRLLDQMDEGKDDEQA